jgi:hypothetical protein
MGLNRRLFSFISFNKQQDEVYACRFDGRRIRNQASASDL